MSLPTPDRAPVRALVFDVFGTVVDWRGTIVREGEALSAANGWRVDWPAFADAWRDLGADHTVTRRDLHVDPLPHLSDSSLHWPPRLRQPGDAPDPVHEALQQALIAELDRISQIVWRRIAEKEINGRTVTLKVKFRDFQVVTRAKSLDRNVAGREEFLEIGVALLRTLLPVGKGIRLLGLTLSNLTEGGEREDDEPAELELELPL